MNRERIGYLVREVLRERLPDLKCEVVTDPYGDEGGMRASLVDSPRKKNTMMLITSAILPRAVGEQEAVCGLAGRLIQKLAAEWNFRVKK